MNGTDLITWLLAARTPSIRYLTSRNLLGFPESDPQIRTARQEIETTGPVPAILASQTARGNWAGEHSYYTPKYVSTHWSMLLLAELGAVGSDERVRRGAEFMLADTEDRLRAEGSGFACFWGNLLRYSLHCKFEGDPRLACVVARLEREALEHGWRCPINAELPCAWGVARALWGLAALPAAQRSAQTRAATESGLDFLLRKHSLIEADYPTRGSIHPLWFRLNFPLFYQADILFVLRVLAELGALGHPNAQAAMAWLAEQRRSDGHWRGSSPFRQRTWVALADHEETNRWVSLHTAIILGERT